MARKRTLKSKRRRSPSRFELLDVVVSNGIRKLESGDIKVSASDVTRLIQFHRELSPQPLLRPVVTWIERKPRAE